MGLISDFITNVTAFRVTIGDKLLSLASRLGNLSLLTTSSKSNLVDAVNEVNTGLGNVQNNFHRLSKNITEATSGAYYNSSPGIEADNILGNVSAYMNSGTIAGVAFTAQHIVSYGLNSNYGYHFYKHASSNSPLRIRARVNNVWQPEETFAYQSWVNSALGPYVLQSALNTQLSNYATLAGTQTFTGTNTFSQAPVVPAGTLNSHTVNLGQLNNILGSYFSFKRGLVASEDLDTVTGIGTYSATLAVAPTLVNSPYTGSQTAILNVFVSSNYLVQEYIVTGGVNTNYKYIRTKNGANPWSPWDTLWSSKNFDPGTKVDKVAGKQLSTEDYTTTEKSKLAGIQAGAEVNVNADWNATTGDAQILNKPTIPTVNNPTITFQGTGSITGGGGFSLNQASGATYSFDLQSSVKTDIQNGATAYSWGNHANAGYATIIYVDNAISNLKFVSRTYDAADVNNNDRYIGSNIISSHTVEGFDVCVYNPGDNGFISPFAGGSNLHNAFMGVLGIQVGSDIVIKGSIQSPNDLSPFIGNNQVYFCLAYIFTSGGATGVIQFMSMADIYNHKASATASESKDVIIIGEIGAPDILLLNQREV